MEGPRCPVDEFAGSGNAGYPWNTWPVRISVGECPLGEGAGGSGRLVPLANSVGPTEQERI